MKRNFKKSLFVLLLAPALNYAQVGINNTDPKAQLDIVASNAAAPLSTDGILIPRINAFPGTNPGADQNAMLVYLNVASGSNPIGFYYWNNATTAWLPFGGGTTNGWDLLGNAGTVNGTNFLGTTDAQALDIRTDNVIRARITTKGQIEILNTGRSVFLGNGAGANDDLGNRENTYIGNTSGNASTTGVINVGVGSGTLSSITTTSKNVAVGSFAMSASTSATSNVAIGTQSLQKSNGDFNTGIGQQVLANLTTGNKNVAIGAYAGLNINGDDNVSIGHEADKDNNGGTQNVTIGSGAGASSGNKDNDGNILIGYNAAKNIATDNSLYIENSSSVTPLVYGEFDNNIVRIGGQLQVGSSDNATVGSIYAFPTVDGTVGQALVTDGSGNVSWGTVTGGGADTQDLSINNTNAELSLVDGGTVKLSTIADADTDTKIQVEESADEDIIRLDLAGTETVTFQGARINTINTGSSTFLGDKAGASDDLTNNNTTFIGFEAGTDITTGYWNTAIGYQSLKGSVTAHSNTMVGYNSGVGTTTDTNVGIGRWTMRFNEPNSANQGGANVAIGASNSSYSFGKNNVAVGAYAMTVSNTGTQFLEGNVAVGHGAAYFMRDASGNVALGEDALATITSGDNNVAIGHEAARRIKNGSENNIMIGYQVGGNSTTVSDQRTFKNSILIGNNAGFKEDEGAEDRLYIEQSGSRTPLIGGDFANDRVGININMTTAMAAPGQAPTALTHTLTVGGSVKVQTLMNLEPTTAPTTPDRGDVYYDNATNKVRVWTGAAWENLN